MNLGVLGWSQTQVHYLANINILRFYSLALSTMHLRVYNIFLHQFKTVMNYNHS